MTTPSTAGWLVEHPCDDGNVHIRPIDDLIAHTESTDCVCGPTLEFLDTDGPDVWMVSHHALDRRC